MKKENGEENNSKAYSSHHKKKGTFNKFKGPKNKVDLSEIECSNCHKMGQYKNQCNENPRNRNRDRGQKNITNEAPTKKNKAEE